MGRKPNSSLQLWMMKKAGNRVRAIAALFLICFISSFSRYSPPPFFTNASHYEFTNDYLTSINKLNKGPLPYEPYAPRETPQLA